MQAPMLSGLPIDEVLHDVLGALEDQRTVVVEAPTGAGKTTHVPLALLDAAWRDDGKIVVLEPRRLAARAAARRMSDLLGEEVGRTVGYVTRDERQVSRATRVEVVTEGILVRRIQRTPALEGVAAVVFDEFHERSLDADLGLAFALEVAGALRDDLRLAAMSATLDGARVAGLMGDAPVVASHGRQYPVGTHHRPPPRPGAIAGPMAAVIAEALDRHPDGHVLAFLPGAREIRRTARELEQRGVAAADLLVAPLYGALAPSDQDRALDPMPPGVRKVVLATDIAETSLTIEGVRIVVDSGLTREPRFEPRTGMSRLETVRISKASAEQRQGRAGRTSPGVCYRLWSEREHHGLEAFTAPEIIQADLAPFALEVAAWGAEVDELRLLDPPPETTYEQARDLLEQLGALHDGSITAHGRELVELPLHPRLAHMIVTAADDGLGGLACDVAALLADRDVLVTDWDRPCVDAAVRVRMLRDRSVAPPRGARVRGGVLERARRQARRLRRIAGLDPRAGGPAHKTGRVLARAYPDRIARRRGAARGSFVLSNGRGAAVPDADVLAGEEFLVIADVAGGGRDARVWLAAALATDDIREVLGDRVVTEELVTWDDASGDVVRARRERVGEVVLRSATLGSPPDEATTDALLEGIRREGLRLLPWTRHLEELRARVAFLRRTFGAAWPDCSDEALLTELEDWLAPFLVSVHRRAHLDRVPLHEALRARIGWDRLEELERLAPERLEVPSGSNIRLDYRSGDVPVLAARIQELFGLTSTPTVAGGRMKVMLHLLSPAQRPVQVTRDLAGFWRRTYPEVRRELRGRYPKHHWPEDPRRARATRDGLPPR